MIVRSGTGVSIPILFSSGNPDGDVTYKIFTPAGETLGSGVITVPDDAVSAVIQVPSERNALPVGVLSSYRDVEWTYTVGDQMVYDEVRYTIEARLPFGVSADGVRAKLGVDAKDLPNSDISLVKAYLAFQSVVSLADFDMSLAPQVSKIGDAIEALAALILIPTMSVRVASKESSGTNQYQRQEVDWSAVQVNLEGIVSDGYLAANPVYDETANFGSLLIVVRPATDAITGA